MKEMDLPLVVSVRSMELRHHVEQAAAWLSMSDNGKSTSYLSYAAFELRLAAERLVLQYWADLHPNGIEERDLCDIKSFKSIQARIYELGGNQKEINALFSFYAILMKILQIPSQIVAPNIGHLQRYWHDCSELCHIAWSIASYDAAVQQEQYLLLSHIQAELQQCMNSIIGWPNISDAAFIELKDRFVAGQAHEEDVRAYLKRTGVWAKYTPSDGRPSSFVGKAIPPADIDSGEQRE
jgi:hypothetical protein